jgi:hypothetical protein
LFEAVIMIRLFIYPAVAISLTVGLSALEGMRKQLIGKVTIATVFPNISKNSTL